MLRYSGKFGKKAERVTGGEQYGIEDAQAAGNMADESRDLGDDEDREEEGEAHRARGGEEDIEHEGGQEPIDQRNPDLEKGYAAVGEADLA